MFRTIRKIGKKPAHSCPNVPVHRSDGQPCSSADEELECWHSHYDNALNHAAASPYPDLDSDAANVTPDTGIPDDSPTMGEVRRAIQKLKNGRAAGPDGIQPELLKYAELPTSAALHELFAQVWKTGRVPAEWREGIIVSLYKGRGPRTACGTGQSLCCQCLVKYLHTSYSTGSNLCSLLIEDHSSRDLPGAAPQ